MKWIKGLLYVFLILVFGYFFYGEKVLPQDKFGFQDEVSVYSEGWSEKGEDGFMTPIEIPHKFSERITIVKTLPDSISEKNNRILFRGEKTDVYVDGILRTSYNNDGKRIFGTETTECYFLIPLKSEDAGKEIRIEADSFYGTLYPVYIGSETGILHFMLRAYGPELAVALLTLFLGIVSLLGCAVLTLVFKRKVPLVHLSFCVCFAALWITFNSVCGDLVFHNGAIVGDMRFCMIMLIPFPMIFYLNEIQKRRHRKVYMFCSLIGIVNLLVTTTLCVTDIAPFKKSFLSTALCCFVIILMMGITIVKDIITKHVLEYKYVSVGLIGVMLAACLQIYMYFNREGVFSGVILAIGLLVLLFFAVIHTVYEVSAMEKEKQRAIMASEAKGQFLANMSHEIRTPINAILGMNEMVLRESSEEEIRGYAMDIQTAGKGLLGIINDILDFSKIEADKLELIPEEYDISSVIHDLTNMVWEKADKKGLKLELKVNKELPSLLYGDDIRIKQVLLNILNNAVKYTNRGQVTFSVDGKVEDQKVLLHFAVKDTGIGIKEEDLGKLFVEFERIEEKRNRNIEGTGLGMNITTKLLALMDSELKVESVYGEGSTFSFDLWQDIINAEPIGDIEERVRNLSREYDYRLTWAAKDVRVLVVDDNDINRKVFKNLLKGTGILIQDAASGADGIEYAKNMAFDMIFLDHMMPEMDGVETLHRFKALTENASKNATVVALTANAVSGAKEFYLNEGFDDYLSKPILMDRLEKMIHKYIDAGRIIPIEENGDAPKTDQPADKAKEAEAGTDGAKSALLQAFTQIPRLDIEGAKAFHPDMQTMYEVALDFYGAIDAEADALEGYFKDLAEHKGDEEKALSSYRIKVHAMKSSAAMIGAKKLSEDAKALETAAKEKQVEIVLADTPAFLVEWRGYREILSVCVPKEEENAADKKDCDPAEVSRILDVLAGAMEEMDVDLADEQIQLLKNYRYTDTAEKMITDLADAVMNLDTEKTAELAKEIKTEVCGG